MTIDAESNARLTPRLLRQTVLDMAYSGSTVHIGCAFSIIEILAVLYRDHLRYPGNRLDAPDRDYLILSKGHGVMAQYACLHAMGHIADDSICHYFEDGTDLKGLSDSRVQGLEVTSGSLGHGFSVGVGISKGLRMRGSDRKVYAIVGDGELNEGAIWEGLMFASHHKLDNLLLIVDANGFQAMGSTDDVMALGDIVAKLESFGCVATSADGHDENSISAAIRTLEADASGCPRALVARTVKGKGVPFMENDNSWHYTRLTADTYARASRLLAELD